MEDDDTKLQGSVPSQQTCDTVLTDEHMELLCPTTFQQLYEET